MLRFKPFSRKTSVTCERTDKEHIGKSFVTITDEANGSVLTQVHSKDDDAKFAYWFRLDKDVFLGMIGSLWPDEVAIVTDEDEDEDA